MLDPPLPEIALLGRSNVGKSSLINALVGQRIAKVSATPGKTRMMNVFLVSGEWDVGRGSHSPRPTPHALYFLDLPGYGYARASHAEQAGFRHLLDGALERERLAGVLWLLDVRREPSVADRALRERFAARGVPVLAAVTKGDKVPRGRRVARARALGEDLELQPDQIVVTSVTTGDGIAELRETLAGLVGKEA